MIKNFKMILRKILRMILFIKPGQDLLLTTTVILLSLFGTLMIVSVISGSIADIRTIAFTIVKLILFLVFGYFLMSFFSNSFSIKVFKKYEFTIFSILCIMMFSCIFFAIEDRGSYAWIRIGPFSIQPSEFVKIFVIIFVASYFSNRRFLSKINDIKIVMKKPLLFFALIIFFILMVQKDLGTTIIVAFLAFVCFLIPSHLLLKKSQKIVGFFLIAGILCFFLSTTPIGLKIIDKLFFLPAYQKFRFLCAANPFNYMYDEGYQLVNGLIAFSEGSLIGVGLGNSMIKVGYLAAAHTDFILAIIVEELGFVLGFLPILIAYSIIIIRLVSYGINITEEYCKVILFGTASLFFIHFLLNIGGTTAIVPLTGVPLLLVSNGGTALWTSFILIGICQNIIARYNKGELV